MRKYLLNKGFIPESFVRRSEKNIGRNNIKALIIITIAVLLFLPNTVAIMLSNVYPNKEQCDKDEDIKKTDKLNNESFYKWMDIIKDDTVGTFNDNDAIIYIDGINRLQDIIKDEKIEVSNVEDIGDKRYKVQVNISTEE